MVLKNDIWPQIRRKFIASAATEYQGVFVGETFSLDGFDAWLSRHGIAWPRTDTGKPRTDQDTFREYARFHPEVRKLKDLRAVISQLKINRLAVGPDGRNRYMTGVFGSITGRNQPSNTKCIFGLSSWLRGLISPKESMALAYIDFGQQEFAIAAALSRDAKMMAAYQSGDPYLGSAILAGLAPANATKATHLEIRELFKVVILGVQYGMGLDSLALRLGGDKVTARRLLDLHHSTFARYWEWLEEVVNTACLEGRLRAALGWQMNLTRSTKYKTITNWLMQANGSEMLRLAVCLATDRGVRIVAMVHDALLIEAPYDQIEFMAQQASEAMVQASEIVLHGFSVRTDCRIIRYPDRFLAAKDQSMWNQILGMINDFQK